MRRRLHEMRQWDADDVQHVLQLERGALTILHWHSRSGLGRKLGTDQLAARYALVVSAAFRSVMQHSDKKRELRMALAFALGLALVCFGGAVVACTFISH